MSAHFSFKQELYPMLQINWKYRTLIVDTDSIILVVAAADTK